MHVQYSIIIIVVCYWWSFANLVTYIYIILYKHNTSVTSHMISKAINNSVVLKL